MENNQSNSFSSIEEMIDMVREKTAGMSRCAELFANCISDTLEKTVRTGKDGSKFVITGDIPAMWLRDSSCQMRPFLFAAEKNRAIREMIVGVIKKQMECILLDPYANAFNEEANGRCFRQDHTDMKPELWERKYEIDSLCFPLQLSCLLWINTGCTEQFTEAWKKAVRKVMQTFRTEQYHETKSPYFFEREGMKYTETLSRNGKGALVKEGTGLIWSGFRPSDDACTYGYLIPSNMLASVVLRSVSEVFSRIYRDEEMAEEALAFSGEIEAAVEQFGVMPGLEEPVYAYEADGFGQYLFMDDANLPSLLSIPYIGYLDRDPSGKKSEIYRNTRKHILSEENPYYYSGKALSGIGSPHTKPGMVWHISCAMEGLASDDPEEKKKAIQKLIRTDAGTGLMHEGVDCSDCTKYSRPWFSWANSIYCELVLDYCGYALKRGE